MWQGARGLAEDVRYYGRGYVIVHLNESASFIQRRAITRSRWRRSNCDRVDLGAHGTVPESGLRRTNASRPIICPVYKAG